MEGLLFMVTTLFYKHIMEVFLLCRKNKHWNVKTLVFMALLIAMHLVLTRVLVIDLGAYRISVGSVCYNSGRSLAGPGSGRCLWIMCGYYRMLYERICCKSVYHSCSNPLGCASCPCKTIICKQKENRKDSWYLRIYRGNCSSQLSGT